MHVFPLIRLFLRCLNLIGPARGLKSHVITVADDSETGLALPVLRLQFMNLIQNLLGSLRGP